MKKALLLVFTCTFLLSACTSPKEEETKTNQPPDTTTPISSSTEEILDDNDNQNNNQNDTIVVTDPQNEYDNNKLIFYFEEDKLAKVEYILIFDSQDDALLAENLYQAYAAEYNSIKLDGLTLTVDYGNAMLGQYPASKDELVTYLESEGYMVIN